MRISDVFLAGHKKACFKAALDLGTFVKIIWRSLKFI